MISDSAEEIPGLGRRKMRYHGGLVREAWGIEYDVRINAASAAAREKAEQVRDRFGDYPCVSAGTEMSAYCPLAGLGGCTGPGSVCDAGYVAESAMYTKLLREPGMPRNLRKFSRPREYLRRLIKDAIKDAKDAARQGLDMQRSGRGG